MGNHSSPGLKRFFGIAKVLSWAGAAGGVYGGWTLATMGIPGIFGGVVGVGAAAIGGVLGIAAGFGVAIPVAVGATIVGNVVKKSLGDIFGKKQPQQSIIPAPAPQPVADVVKESLQEVKSAAQEFNAEAAVELADNITFHKLKLSPRNKPETQNTPGA